MKFVKSLTVFLLYFCLRFFNLLTIPIFNDEAIYLDWGFREVNIPGNLYFSLFDGKQPLLMWLYGLIQNLPVDPLWGARALSVLFGSLTLVGIYLLAKNTFSEKVAFLACILYCIIPIFSFFDRQALMESGICCIGVWSLYLTIEVINTYSLKAAFALGSILGLGFFVKSSAVIFVFSSLFLLLVAFIKASKSVKIKLIKTIGMIIFQSQLMLLPLYLQPDFKFIFIRNDRFTLTITELIHIPITHWISNFTSTFQISIWQLGPAMIICSLLGAYIIFSKKQKSKNLILFWWLVGLFIFMITIRSPSPRYLVAFLPISTILCAVFLQTVSNVHKNYYYFFLFVCTVPATLVTIFQLLSPTHYLQFMKYDEYVQSWPSGYGVQTAVNYLNIEAEHQKIEVWELGEWGNPESSVFTYLRKNPNVYIYPYSSDRLKDVQRPVFIVTRNDERKELKGHVDLQKKIPKPFGSNSISVYKLANICSMD